MSGISHPGRTSTQLLTKVKWAVEDDLFLTEFIERYTLPHLGLITKGQYLGSGAPNLASPGLQPYIFLHSKQRIRKVLGQLVKLKEGRRAILTGQVVSIPESYSGLFEILSEDGRPVKCIESVTELTQRFPEQCLVRQSCKAFLPDYDGELRSLYRSRTIEYGELLTLVGQFTFKQAAFLRCFDESGNSVYLKMSQKGKFSQVARKDAITGVHHVRNLMAKRLPLTVRLVHGQFSADLKPPTTPAIIRLTSIVEEDFVFAQSIQKSPQFLLIPLNAHLKLAPATNHVHVAEQTEFFELSEDCEELLPSFLERIEKVTNSFLPNDSAPTPSIAACTGSGTFTATAVNVQQADNVSQVTITDEEIDQLYDYIRGFAPLPGLKARPEVKPTPPPLETLPSRKLTAAEQAPATTSQSQKLKHPKKSSGSNQTDSAQTVPKSAPTVKMRERRNDDSRHTQQPQADVDLSSVIAHLQSTIISVDSPSQTLQYDSDTVGAADKRKSPPLNSDTPSNTEKRLDSIIYGNKECNRSALPSRVLGPIPMAIANRIRNAHAKAMSRSADKLHHASADEGRSDRLYISKIQLSDANQNSRRHSVVDVHPGQPRKSTTTESYQITPKSAPHIPSAVQISRKQRPKSLAISDSSSPFIHDNAHSSLFYCKEPAQPAYRSISNLMEAPMFAVPPNFLPPPPYPLGHHDQQLLRYPTPNCQYATQRSMPGMPVSYGQDNWPYKSTAYIDSGLILRKRK